MTLIEDIRHGNVPEIIHTVAASEGIAAEKLGEQIAGGTTVILFNISRDLR